MATRTLLRMGDPRLQLRAAEVREFGTPALDALLRDMFDTMQSAGGVGLAAPQIGESLRVVIFGFERSERYPDAASVPRTILINPVLTPLGVEEEEVNPNAKFIEDLGADSLDTVELVMALEEHFDIQIPDEEAEKIVTVGDAIQYIKENS